MLRQITKTFSLILLLLIACLKLSAQSVRIAIAANLQPVMKVIKADIKKSKGINVELISGASGGLATQIRNGAPYDVFMSADTAFPAALQKDGFGIKGAQVYAEGVLIICSKQNLNFSNWPGLLQQGSIQKIAIGNPKTAPYGKAAMQALSKVGVYKLLAGKLVFGESISQVNTYILQGAALTGFTTLSLVKDPLNKDSLNYKEIDPKSYEPITQSMLLLKHAKGNISAAEVYAYLSGPQAKKRFKQFGYHVQ